MEVGTFIVCWYPWKGTWVCPDVYWKLRHELVSRILCLSVCTSVCLCMTLILWFDSTTVDENSFSTTALCGRLSQPDDGAFSSASITVPCRSSPPVASREMVRTIWVGNSFWLLFSYLVVEGQSRKKNSPVSILQDAWGFCLWHWETRGIRKFSPCIVWLFGMES